MSQQNKGVFWDCHGVPHCEWCGNEIIHEKWEKNGNGIWICDWCEKIFDGVDEEHLNLRRKKKK